MIQRTPQARSARTTATAGDVHALWSPRARLFYKLLLVTGLLTLLVRKGLLSLGATASAFDHPKLLLIGLALSCFAAAVAFFRWKILLQPLGIQMPMGVVVELGLIGCLFNLALPGAVTGDLVKAYYAGKKGAGSKKSRAFSSILFDRLCGVSGLVLLAAGAMLHGYGLPTGSRLFLALRPMLLASGIGVIVFYGYLFLVRPGWDPLRKVLVRFSRRWRALGAVERVYDGISAYGGSRLTVLAALMMSVCIQFAAVSACACFATALGAGDIETTGLMIAVPMGLLVTAVPILPGGVGTGHYAFAAFFQLLGSPRGADIFSLWLLTQIFIGALGGIAYLRHRTELGQAA
jgi:uncharacterized protein (TIRG00374 family)